MGSRAASTRRSTATSTVSNQAVVINSGNTAPAGTTAFTIAGAVSANTTVTIGVVTPGQSSANSSVASSSGPIIANLQYLDANNTVITGANAVSTAGGNILVNGSNFVTNSSVYLNNSLTTNTFISSSQIRVIGPAASAGNVTLMIFSPTNTGTVGPNVRYSGVPSWTTAAVSFTSGNASNVALVASSDSTLTYTLQAGSTLPTNISLISTGYLSGTPTGYSVNSSGSFVLVATDQEGQAAQQTINWTVTVGDSQFNYVTLLLNGDTGNNISNAATNNTFLDSSTNNFTITRGGTVTQGSFSPYSATGWSNYFNGSSDSFTTASAATALTLTSAWTIEFWVNTTQTARTDVVSPNYTYTSTGWFLLSFGYTTTGASGTIDYVETGGGAAKISGTFNRNGTWQHVALTKTGTSVRLFVNGTQIGTTYTTSQTQWCANNSGFLIGNQYSSSVWYNGYISNLRILNGTALYTSAFTPPTSPLTAIANTALLTSQNNRFIDNSTNALAITLQGAPSVQASSPFVPGSSYASATNGGSSYFNSASDTLTYGGIAGPQGTEDFTFEFWWYFAPGGIGGSFPRLFETTTANGFQVYLSGGTLVVAQNGGATVLSYSISSYVNQWAHICLTRVGATMRLFVNGVLQGYTASGGTNFAAASSFRTLTEGGGPVGFMSDLRTVRGSVVSAYSTAVTTTGTSVFTPPTTPLTAVSGTALLCSFTNGAIVDAHASTDIITVGAALNTTTKKFGTASIFFNGTSDKLTMPASPNWIFGTGDFTVEFWMNTADTGAGLITPATTGAGYWALLINSSTLYWQSSFNVTNLKSASLSGYLNNTWVHIAVVRYSGNLYFYFNGTAQGAATADSTNYSGATNTLTIGYDNSATNGYYAGYIDDLRITKGFARYTANFTAPTSAFQGQ